MNSGSLHRTILRVGHWFRKRWWEIGVARPRVCRILAIDTNGRVLMVRHSYGSPRWSLPGGGIGFRETALETAYRELREETGCVLVQARLLDRFEERVRRSTLRVSLVGGRFEGSPRPDRREVTHVGIYPANAIPVDCLSGMASTIERWLPLLRDTLASDDTA